MLASSFGTGEVFLSMVYFFLFFVWIMLLFNVFADLFRDHELSGFAKVIWIIFLIIAPFLGVFIYLIARGPGMAKRQAKDMQAQEQAFKEYVQQTAGTGTADELAKLADLKAQGVISDAEFEAQKAKLLG